MLPSDLVVATVGRAAFRKGGEEFAIILPEIDQHNAMQLADKVRRLIERTGFRFEDTDIPLTVSVGVATLGSDTVDWAVESVRCDEIRVGWIRKRRRQRNRSDRATERSQFAHHAPVVAVAAGDGRDRPRHQQGDAHQ